MTATGVTLAWVSSLLEHKLCRIGAARWGHDHILAHFHPSSITAGRDRSCKDMIYM